MKNLIKEPSPLNLKTPNIINSFDNFKLKLKSNQSSLRKLNKNNTYKPLGVDILTLNQKNKTYFFAPAGQDRFFKDHFEKFLFDESLFVFGDLKKTEPLDFLSFYIQDLSNTYTFQFDLFALKFYRRQTFFIDGGQINGFILPPKISTNLSKGTIKNFFFLEEGFQQFEFFDNYFIENKGGLASLSYESFYLEEELVRLKNFFIYFSTDLITSYQSQLITPVILEEGEEVTEDKELPVLMDTWVETGLKTKTTLIKNLFHVKYITCLESFLLNDCISFFHYYFLNKNTEEEKSYLLEHNTVNFVFKIKQTILMIRVLFLNYFDLYHTTHKQVNRLLVGFKNYSVLNYIWFMEYNSLILLVKLKLSNSLLYSTFLIERGLVYNNRVMVISK